MESNSEKNKITLSRDAKEALAQQAPAARVVSRGEVNVKGKGRQELFFLDGSPEAAAITLEIPYVDTAPMRRLSLPSYLIGQAPLVGRRSFGDLAAAGLARQKPPGSSGESDVAVNGVEA